MTGTEFASDYKSLSGKELANSLPDKAKAKVYIHGNQFSVVNSVFWLQKPTSIVQKWLFLLQNHTKKMKIYFRDNYTIFLDKIHITVV